MVKQLQFSILLVLTCSLSYGQSANKDSALTPSDNAAALFNREIKSQSRLFNGTTYFTYGSNVGGSANFNDLPLTKGTVVYDGVKFDDVPLLYDLYLDNLVTTSYGNATMVSLIKNKVSDFYINNHHFVYLNNPGNLLGLPVAAGFYDLIYEGKFKVLVKRTKKLQFSTNAETPYYFTPKTTYFLERDNRYYEFDNESSFLNLFKEKKNEIKKYLLENKIKFKENPDEAIANLARYYEQI